MELRLYLRMLLKGWWLIALCALAALNFALITSYHSTPMYRTSARFIVMPNEARAESNDEVVESLNTLDKRSIISTYAEVFDSQRIFNDATEELQVESQALQQAGYELTVVVLPDANVLEVTIVGPNPELIATLTNAIGDHAMGYIRSVYHAYDIDFLDHALPPSTPFTPNIPRDASLACALGIIIGSVLAILLEQLRVPIETFLKRNIVDSASNAHNRQYVQRRLEAEVLSNAHESTSFGLVLFDRLEDMIDTLPRSVVNEILRHITRTLQHELRGRDIVGRWNETTFAILLPATPEYAANRVFQRIQQAIAQPVQIAQDQTAVLLHPRSCVATHRTDEPVADLIERTERELERTHYTNGKPDNEQLSTEPSPTLTRAPDGAPSYSLAENGSQTAETTGKSNL